MEQEECGYQEWPMCLSSSPPGCPPNWLFSLAMPLCPVPRTNSPPPPPLTPRHPSPAAPAALSSVPPCPQDRSQWSGNRRKKTAKDHGCAKTPSRDAHYLACAFFPTFLGHLLQIAHDLTSVCIVFTFHPLHYYPVLTVIPILGSIVWMNCRVRR